MSIRDTINDNYYRLGRLDGERTQAAEIGELKAKLKASQAALGELLAVKVAVDRELAELRGEVVERLAITINDINKQTANILREQTDPQFAALFSVLEWHEGGFDRHGNQAPTWDDLPPGAFEGAIKKALWPLQLADVPGAMGLAIELNLMLQSSDDTRELAANALL